MPSLPSRTHYCSGHHACFPPGHRECLFATHLTSNLRHRTLNLLFRTVFFVYISPGFTMLAFSNRKLKRRTLNMVGVLPLDAIRASRHHHLTFPLWRCARIFAAILRNCAHWLPRFTRRWPGQHTWRKPTLLPPPHLPHPHPPCAHTHCTSIATPALALHTSGSLAGRAVPAIPLAHC